MSAVAEEEVFVNAPRAVEVLAQCGVRVSQWRLYQLVREGYLPAGQVVLREGSKLRFRSQGLVDWVNAGGSQRPRSSAA